MDCPSRPGRMTAIAQITGLTAGRVTKPKAIRLFSSIQEALFSSKYRSLGDCSCLDLNLKKIPRKDFNTGTNHCSTPSIAY